METKALYVQWKSVRFYVYMWPLHFQTIYRTENKSSENAEGFYVLYGFSMFPRAEANVLKKNLFRYLIKEYSAEQKNILPQKELKALTYSGVELWPKHDAAFRFSLSHTVFP